MKRMIPLITTAVLVAGALASCAPSSPGAVATRFVALVDQGKLEDAAELVYIPEGDDSKEAAAKLNLILTQMNSELSKKGGLRDVTAGEPTIEGDKASVALAMTYGNGSSDSERMHLVRPQGRWLVSLEK